MLITSLRKKNWIIPKGIVEEGLSDQESASKEAFEEAGISGQVEPALLGNYRYKKWGGSCSVNVYACEVTRVHRAWPEMKLRKRRWFSTAKVLSMIGNPDLQEIVRLFVSRLEKNCFSKR
jgi:8-oxo-dGTP pyrophosphatase MutT (NUDIX family)